MTTPLNLGLQYPLVGGHKGRLAQSSGINQIKADLKLLLLTNPGERVMLPEFGTPLSELLFEPNDGILAARARQMVAESLQTWEGDRIIVDSIDVRKGVHEDARHPDDTDHELDHVLSISIRFFDPMNINQVETLVLRRPIGG